MLCSAESGKVCTWGDVMLQFSSELILAWELIQLSGSKASHAFWEPWNAPPDPWVLIHGEIGYRIIKVKYVGKIYTGFKKRRNLPVWTSTTLEPFYDIEKSKAPTKPGGKS